MPDRPLTDALINTISPRISTCPHVTVATTVSPAAAQVPTQFPAAVHWHTSATVSSQSHATASVNPNTTAGDGSASPVDESAGTSRGPAVSAVPVVNVNRCVFGGPYRGVVGVVVSFSDNRGTVTRYFLVAVSCPQSTAMAPRRAWLLASTPATCRQVTAASSAVPQVLSAPQSSTVMGWPSSCSTDSEKNSVGTAPRTTFSSPSIGELATTTGAEYSRFAAITVN
mmetsp:Transcript_5305/g.11450  ORF Transcript_5305/g.11450 Transcript_5305/m.11450 type:complete len:226 (+) Transcript_5305:948-1625(+)